jgi:hypothetical protein
LKRFEKEEYYHPRNNIACGENSNLSVLSALQVKVILLKTFIEVTHTKKKTVARPVNNIKFITYLIEKETVDNM